jgi:hypothetical protein
VSDAEVDRPAQDLEREALDVLGEVIRDEDASHRLRVASSRDGRVFREEIHQPACADIFPDSIV